MCRKFKVALENHNAKLKAELEEFQTTKRQGKSLRKQLHGCEDMQTSLSSQIKDLTLIPDQGPTQEVDVGQPEVKPQENLREQTEANPDQPALPGETADEEIPALIASGMKDFALDEKLNKANLDAPIKTESDSSVEKQITEAMAE